MTLVDTLTASPVNPIAPEAKKSGTDIILCKYEDSDMVDSHSEAAWRPLRILSVREVGE
ncbi:hypothetical protein FRC18_006998 [Serendipita sp. 400]|nr:hypothetical protein FRC18_006998 [Serendipita sp. 400]